MNPQPDICRLLDFSDVSILVLLFFLLWPALLFGVESDLPQRTASEQTLVIQNSVLSQLTGEEILTLSPRQIKKKTGQRLTFREKIALGLTRKALQKRSELSEQIDTNALMSFLAGVFGLISVSLSLFFPIGVLFELGFILGISALPLSIAGLRRTKSGRRGRGFAIAGFLIGLLFLVSGIVLTIVLIIAVANWAWGF